MTQEKHTIVIPRENAVFRMDGQGTWHNEHGPFEHPKIILYFNRSIQRDDQGFFLCQEMENAFEKVYFPYEETAYFVADVNPRNPRDLILNTGQRISLDPLALFARNDSLYLRRPDCLVKFTPRALLKLSKHMTERGDALVLTLDKQEFPIPEED